MAFYDTQNKHNIMVNYFTTKVGTEEPHRSYILTHHNYSNNLIFECIGVEYSAYTLALSVLWNSKIKIQFSNFFANKYFSSLGKIQTKNVFL